MATAYRGAQSFRATRAFRAARAGLAFLGLCWLVVLTVGCGSSEYEQQIDATASELRRGQPAAADGAETEDDAASAPTPQPERQAADKNAGAGRTGVGNAIGLAPM